MEIVRVGNAEELNRIVNDPSVYPWVHANIEGPLDLTAVVETPGNHCLLGKNGAVVFVRHQDGLYEAHTQVLPAGRGPWALEFVKAALHWQFAQTDAVEIWTRVPKGNLAARALARSIGGTLACRVDRGWVVDGQSVWADIFSLTVQDWMRSAPGLEEIGSLFLNKLRAEYERHGRSFAPVEDAATQRYLGAAVEMVRGPAPGKGAAFWNRFAAMAGLAPIRIVRVDPVMIAFDDVVLELHGRNFFIAEIAAVQRH